jgi:hypothetical protein
MEAGGFVRECEHEGRELHGRVTVRSEGDDGENRLVS